MAGFDTDVMFADNIDFSGGFPVTGKITTDGQILIGSTAAPHIRVGSFTSSGGTLNITTGAGTINLDVSAVAGGDVTGPGSSTDNAIARFDLTTGKIIQNSGVIIDDSDVVSGATQLNVDNLRLDGNDISSTDTNGNITLSPDGTGIVSTMSALSVGGVAESDITIGGVAIDGTVIVHTEGATDLAELLVERHSDTAGFGAHLIFARSRGTEASETVVQDNDVLSQIVSVGQDGTDFEQASVIRTEVDGTPGDGDMPGRIVMLTSADGAASPIEGFRLDSSQNVTLANSLTVPNGGTGTTSLTDGGVILGSGVGAVTVLAQATDGQLVIGSSGVDPVLAALASADASVTITNGGGTIDLSVSSGGLIAWVEVTGTSVAMVVNTGYILNNAGLVTATLPTTAALGSVLQVVGKGAGGWRIAQNATEIIHFGSSDTTAGTGGRLDSTNQFDAIQLVNTVADDAWTALSSIGNITVT